MWEDIYISPVYALCSRVDVLYSGDIVPSSCYWWWNIVCHSIPRSISLSGMSFRAATLNFPFSVALPFVPSLPGYICCGFNSTNVYLRSGGSGGWSTPCYPPGISVQKLKLLNLLRKRFITLRFLLSLGGLGVAPSWPTLSPHSHVLSCVTLALSLCGYIVATKRGELKWKSQRMAHVMYQGMVLFFVVVLRVVDVWIV